LLVGVWVFFVHFVIFVVQDGKRAICAWRATARIVDIAAGVW